MSVSRVFAVGFIFFVVSIAWQILGATTSSRGSESTQNAAGDIADLWGRPERQLAPTFDHVWPELTKEQRVETVNGAAKSIVEDKWVERREPLNLAATDVSATLRLDQRRKGLIWFSLYDVAFDGSWTVTNGSTREGELEVAFTFPNPSGIYDDFHFEVDGNDLAEQLSPTNGVVSTRIVLKKKQTASLRVRYKTRGANEWVYVPNAGNNVAKLEKFHARIQTDYKDIDYPQAAMSPSTRERAEKGWVLDWAFERVLTGHVLGVTTPTPVQPGELASLLSHSAPVSLGLFFAVLMLLSVLQKREVHPINYAFIAAAFFSFHLVFAYTADLLAVEVAFAIASLTSVALVVSYLRLVVSPQFAFREAAAAQLLYQVGFSLAHFFAGRTGLFITIMLVATLAFMMQLTGRLRWSEVLTPERQR